MKDGDPDEVRNAFDLWYEGDYDHGVKETENSWHTPPLPVGNGKVGAIGYCLGGKLC